MAELKHAEGILKDNWPCVTDALAREPGIHDPVALVMDFRFDRARHLARLLCGAAVADGLGPDQLVLVGVACRRDAADALALVSPRAARRLRRKRAPAGAALAVVVGDGWTFVKAV